jgi:hypothetical protein
MGTARGAGSDNSVRQAIRQVLRSAGIAAPQQGTTLIVHVTRTAESPLEVDGRDVYAIKASLTSSGGLGILQTVGLPAFGEPGPALNECADPVFAGSGDGWNSDEPASWYANTRSFKVAKGLRPARVEKELKKAHTSWGVSRSDCADGDAAPIAFKYAGRARLRNGQDGKNVMVMGRLPSGTLAATFTWTNNQTIVESDTRLNSRTRWSGQIQERRHFFRAPLSARRSAGETKRVAPDDGYSLANVSTHELGHQIGLDDLADPHGELTMYAVITKGESKKISLGTGDIVGATAATS